MTFTRFGRGAREVLLTLGALLGVLCIVASIAGVAFGVKPLVFRSGSMSPAIHTGDLAVSRTVDASDLKTADIVSVVNAEGSRVTHRIVNIASQGASRQLTLKGDANKAADSEVYTVTSAERVLFDIPKAGYVVNAAASPVGVFVLGAYVMTMLLVLFRKGPGGDDDQHRQGLRRKAGAAESQPTERRKGGARKADRNGSRSAARSIAVTAFAATVAVAAPAVAAPWTDPVAITGSAFTSFTVVTPTGSVACANGSAGSESVTVSWPAAGDPATTPQRYKVVVINDNSIINQNMIFFTAVTSNTSFTLQRSALNLPFLYSGGPSVRIYGSAPDGSWQTTNYITRTVRIDLSFRCS